MFKPTPETTIVVPFVPGDAGKLGPIANTEYFGKIPDTRIVRRIHAFFQRRWQGARQARHPAETLQGHRRKLADGFINPHPGANRARWPSRKRDWPYVDSQWKEDVDPFGGDVINAYNDGPPEPGAKPLGPFYELETSSPALFLKPGESHTHTQTTIHLTGPRESLDAIAKHNLGVGLETIEKALP